MQTNKITFIHKKRFWAGLLLVQFLLFFILSKTDWGINFASSFFEWKKNFHTLLSSKIDFSIGDLFYILLGILLIILLVNPFKFQNNIVRLLVIFNSFYSIYQLFWGLLYFQTPFIALLSHEEPSEEQVKNLAIKYLNQCKSTRLKATEDEKGIFEVQDFETIKQEIITQQKQLPYPFNKKRPIENNTIKPSLYKGVMSYTGIFGYYNPFTAEAQYNPELPHTYLPFTMAHEAAHQMGIAREQEANFIGYLIGIQSQNIQLKYSTELFVLKYLLHYLSSKDSK